MGSSSSKTSTAMLKIDIDGNEENIMQNILLDPRSPDVNRTPMANILGSRLKSLEQTPIKYKTSLNTSNAKKLLDPRSPSQFIPRTPLNMSLDGTGIENSIGKYSLEYSGYIEEASCRNFNEKLENITFDDSYTEENKTANISGEKYDICDVGDAVEEENVEISLPKESAERIKRCQNTPITSPVEIKSRFDVNIYTDVENISPVINTTQHTKHSALSAFSSTPISILNNQQKLLSTKKLAKANKDLFIDDKINDETPGKRIMKSKEPRTPFGCLQNQQQMVQKDHENSTPKTKSSAASKRFQIICD